MEQKIKLAAFSEALEALENGKRICRYGWNGADLFVFKQVPAEISIMSVVPHMQSLPKTVKDTFIDRYIQYGDSGKLEDNYIQYQNQMCIVYPNNILYGYTPSTSDVLADDWIVLDGDTTDNQNLYSEQLEFINDFGDAIIALKEGKKVSRKGWNGVDMYLYLVEGQEFDSLTDHAKDTFGKKTPYRQYLALKTAQGDVATWSPSNSDVFSTDWIIH